MHDVAQLELDDASTFQEASQEALQSRRIVKARRNKKGGKPKAVLPAGAAAAATAEMLPLGATPDVQPDADRERSVALKLEGNRLLAAGDLEGARQKYEKSLAHDDRNVASWTNLAAVCLRLDGEVHWTRADQAASKALSLDINNVKARYRRGLARAKLASCRGALGLALGLRDLEQALDIEPRNAEIRAELERVQPLHQSANSEEARLLFERGRRPDVLGTIFDVRDSKHRCESDKYSFKPDKLDLHETRADGPLSSMSREEQKVTLLNGFHVVSATLRAHDFEGAIQMGKGCVGLATVLGEAPATLLAYCQLASANIGLRNLTIAQICVDRASLILKPMFPLSILTKKSFEEVTSHPHRFAGAAEVEDDDMVLGLGHPATAYAPDVFWFCRTMTQMLQGQVLSENGWCSNAIHCYRRALNSLANLQTFCFMVVSLRCNLLCSLADCFFELKRREAAEEMLERAEHVANFFLMPDREAWGDADRLRIRQSRELAARNEGQASSCSRKCYQPRASSVCVFE